jgi:flagellar protein FliS
MPTDMSVNHHSQEYLRTKVLAASPIEAVVMLYEFAINSLNSAIADLKSGDAMSRAKNVTKAQEAVTELAMAVDHSSGASFTTTLVELYAYVQNQIIKGHTEQSEAAFSNAVSILRSLLEGWSQIQPSTSPTEVTEPSPAMASSAAQGSGYGQDTGSYQSRDWTC